LGGRIIHKEEQISRENCVTEEPNGGADLQYVAISAENHIRMDIHIYIGI